jgi:hypothetical protein
LVQYLKFEEMKYFTLGNLIMIFGKTPVVINNRNRLSSLVALLDWLKNKNVEITILDNQSDYLPLLDMYSRIDVNVVRLGSNFGNTALYRWGGHLDFKQRYFIYTDSDIVPKESCPDDLVDYLILHKSQKQEYNKIGASIELGDIPDDYPFRSEVIEWESKYWVEKRGDFFIADVDTTFAAYDVESEASTEHRISNCLRSDRPYTVRHLPWYSCALSEEDIYYARSADAKLPDGRRVGMWTQKHRTLCGIKLL